MVVQANGNAFASLGTDKIRQKPPDRQSRYKDYIYENNLLFLTIACPEKICKKILTARQKNSAIIRYHKLKVPLSSEFVYARIIGDRQGQFGLTA